METEIANNKRYINAIQTVYPYEFKSVSNDNLKIEVTEYKSHGGFGITYLGNYHSREGNKKPFNTQKVIIKEFFMDMGNNGRCVRASNGEYVVFADNTDTIQYFRKKFEKESDILSKLSHPNIVNVLHDFKANNTSYFVMEHIEGVTLMEYIKKNGPFKSFDAAWKYMGPLCEGLKEVHEKGIIHCDISPNNIMVETESNGTDIKRLVLIDFGGCRSYNVNEKEGADLSRVSLMTYTNSYSPLELTNLKFYNETYEDATVKEIKASTDIYSIGATIYFMLTGNHPQDCYELMKKELKFPDGFDSKLAPVIKRSMQSKREDRPQTMDELISLCVNALETEEEKLKKEIDALKKQIIELDSLAFWKIKSDDGKEYKFRYKNYYEDEVKKKNEIEKTLNEKINKIQNENVSLNDKLHPKGSWFSFIVFNAVILVQLYVSIFLVVRLFESSSIWGNLIGYIVVLLSTMIILGIPILFLLTWDMNWDSWGVYLNFLKKDPNPPNWMFSYLQSDYLERVKRFNKKIDIIKNCFQVAIVLILSFSMTVFALTAIKHIKNLILN